MSTENDKLVKAESTQSKDTKDTKASICIHSSDGNIQCHTFHVNALEQDTSTLFHDTVRENVRSTYTKQVCKYYKDDPKAMSTFNKDGSCSLTYEGVRVRLYDFGKWDRDYTPGS